MLDQPLRGAAVRRAGFPLPPQPMPGWRRARPLKRWRYLGVYTPDVMVCIGDARIGPLRQRWWAVAEPDGSLVERTTMGRGGVELGATAARVAARGVRIELALAEPAAVEVLTPTRTSYIWTAKRAPVGVAGTVDIGSRRHEIDGPVGFVDDSAGYHDRHTVWRWCAGVGTSADGHAVAWNLVEGVHDDDRASERTLWVAGEPRELGPTAIAHDLRSARFAEGGELAFTEWSRRTEDVDYKLVSSRYAQPFGTFMGTLPGGLELVGGCGVMEFHDARW